MKAFFMDVHEHLGTFKKTPEHNLAGLLNADDTLVVSNTTQHMRRLMREVEEDTAKCNMPLNKGKCAYITRVKHNIMQFKHGET